MADVPWETLCKQAQLLGIRPARHLSHGDYLPVLMMGKWHLYASAWCKEEGFHASPVSWNEWHDLMHANDWSGDDVLDIAMYLLAEQVCRT